MKITLGMAHGKRAHKTYHADGTIEPYDIGFLVRGEEACVASLCGLHALLGHMEGQSAACLVRGRPHGGELVRRAYKDHVERGPAGFDRCDRAWFCVDIDGAPLPDGADWRMPWRWLDGLLPEPLRGAPAVLQYSGSMGVKPGVYAHVWYVADRAVDDRSLKAWLKSCGVVDLSLYSPVQPHYVAPPRFVGLADPCPVRLFQRGFGCVTLPSCVVDGVTYEAELRAVREAERAAAAAADFAGLVDRGYARAALKSACERIVAAPDGARHTTLRDEAWATVRFVKLYQLDEQEWREALDAAGRLALPQARHEEVDKLLMTALQRTDAA